MLLCCLSCGGGSDTIEPFTRPPITSAPSASAAPRTAEPQPAETKDPEDFAVSFSNEIVAGLLELYISSSELETWGEPAYYDIASGETVEIFFYEFGGIHGELYDIGTIDNNGVNYDCFEVVLLEGDKITLYGSAESADFVIERADGTSQTIPAQICSDHIGGEKRSMFIQPYLSTASEYSEIKTDRYEVDILTSFTSVRLSSLDAERLPMLDRSLNSLNERRTESSSEVYGEFIERAGMASSLSSLASFPASEFKDEVYMISSEENVLSMLFVHSETIGGNTVFKYESSTLDSQTGEELMLSDVATDIQMLEQSIYSELEKAYSELPFDEEFELINEFHAPSEMLAWMLDISGLHILINGKPFGVENMVYSVFLPFSEYSDIVYEHYLPKNENHVSAFPLDFNYQTMIEGKRSALNVSVQSDEAMLRIQYNGAENEIELNSVYEVRAHFVHVNGRDLLYLDMLSDNDIRFLSIFSFEDDAIVELGEFHGSWGYTYETAGDAVLRLVQPMVDPEDFSLYSKTQLLGTADGTKVYSVGDDGLPKSEDKYYLIISPDIEFTLKLPIELHLVTEAGDMDVSTVSLEAGSLLGYLRTDDERFADLILEDGRFVRAVIDDGSIDSVPIEELFESIVYSG